MKLVYVANAKTTAHKAGGIELGVYELGGLDHNVLQEVLHLWNDLGRPECWLFDVPGEAPWHVAAEAQVSPRRGKVSS